MKATILHNPRCSKSRATLQLLIGRGVEVEMVDYQATPLSVTDLRSLLAKLQVPASELVRFGEPLAAEMGLAAGDARSDEQWLQLLAAHPRLLERPIVVVGERAVLGRPPENVLALL